MRSESDKVSPAMRENKHCRDIDFKGRQHSGPDRSVYTREALRPDVGGHGGMIISGWCWFPVRCIQTGGDKNYPGLADPL
jgi:hypothetical protein